MKNLGAAPPPNESVGSSPKTFSFSEPSGLELQTGDYGAGTSAPAEGGACLPDPRGRHADEGLTSEAGPSARQALSGQAGSGLISMHVRPLMSAEDAEMHSAPCPQSPPRYLKTGPGPRRSPAQSQRTCPCSWPTAPCQSPEKPQSPLPAPGRPRTNNG